MSVENKQIIENIWKQFDADNSGVLEENEALQFIKKLCQNSDMKGKEKQIQMIMDADGDGVITKNEVLQLLQGNF